MRNDLQVENDREVRGQILKALDFQYPDTLTTQLIVYAVEAAGYQCGTNQTKIHLAYLAEKGYVKLDTVEVHGMGLARQQASLTAKGKDLLDGNIATDPGVKL